MGEAGKALHEAAESYGLTCCKVCLDLLSIFCSSLLCSYMLLKRNGFFVLLEVIFLRNKKTFKLLDLKEKRGWVAEGNSAASSFFLFTSLNFIISCLSQILALFPAAVFRSIWNPARTFLQVQKELGAMATLTKSAWEMENKGLNLWNNLSGRNDKLRLSESIW